MSKVLQVVDETKEQAFFHKDFIKEYINNSTNNNRTISISQFIKYNSIWNPQLASDIASVYKILLERKYFKMHRMNKKRTDAYDVSELVDVVNIYVETDPSLKSLLGRKIWSV